MPVEKKMPRLFDQQVADTKPTMHPDDRKAMDKAHADREKSNADARDAQLKADPKGVCE